MYLNVGEQRYKYYVEKFDLNKIVDFTSPSNETAKWSYL